MSRRPLPGTPRAWSWRDTCSEHSAWAAARPAGWGSWWRPAPARGSPPDSTRTSWPRILIMLIVLYNLHLLLWLLTCCPRRAWSSWGSTARWGTWSSPSPWTSAARPTAPARAWSCHVMSRHVTSCHVRWPGHVLGDHEPGPLEAVRPVEHHVAVVELLEAEEHRRPPAQLHPGPAQSGHNNVRVTTRASNEGYPKVPEDFTITEKAPTRALSGLKPPTSAFTFKTLLKYYAKQYFNRH